MQKVHRLKLKAMERETKLLLDLYHLRMMTVEQISERHDYTVGTLYHKFREFRKSGLITTGTISGYTVTDDNLKKGKYYRLTGKGVTHLNELGYELEGSVEGLRISEFRVQNVLHFNDLMIYLSSHVWSVLDSREVKRKKNYNRGDIVDGMLISPDEKEYLFYLFLNKVSEARMVKIKLELNKYRFSDIILFTRSREVFKSVLKEMLLSAEVFKYNSFRVLPLGYGKRYLAYYNDSQVLFNYLEDKFNIYELDKDEVERYQVGFNTVVEYEGNEYYLINMLDHDLTHIHFIKRYTRERYKQDGRKILLLTMDLINYREILEGIDHVKYIEIETNEFMNYPTA